jgi:hypothetical protein
MTSGGAADLSARFKLEESDVDLLRTTYYKFNPHDNFYVLTNQRLMSLQSIFANATSTTWYVNIIDSLPKVFGVRLP